MTENTGNNHGNPMRSGMTKHDGAVERLEAWFANHEDIYPDDVRSVLNALKAKDAEIERLRMALSKIMLVRKQPGKCKRMIKGDILSEIELIASQALKGGA